MKGRKSGARMTRQDRKPVSTGRHESLCTICAHKQRADIEEAFIGWGSPASIHKLYGVSRDSIYRHAHAFGLLDRRRRNVRAALERLIERAGDVEVNAAAVVGAVSACARINSRGEWVERRETVCLDALFERMSPDELDAYAKQGTLPPWFKQSAIADDSRGGPNDR